MPNTDKLNKTGFFSVKAVDDFDCCLSRLVEINIWLEWVQEKTGEMETNSN